MWQLRGRVLGQSVLEPEEQMSFRLRIADLPGPGTLGLG